MQSNPFAFAIVTAAHLLTQQSRGKPVQRYTAKWTLARLLYARNWSKQRIIDLFAVIDWMLSIPREMERELLSNIADLEKELGMPYMNPFEKLGREAGRKEGRVEGRVEGLRQLLQTQLESRFGQLPGSAFERLEHANPAELQRWGIALLAASTLDQVFAGR